MGKLKKPPVDVRHECEYNEEIVAKLKDAGWTEKGLAGYGAINHESDVAVITDFKLFESKVDYSFDDYRDFFQLTKANYKDWNGINLAPYNAIYGVNPNKIIEPLRILHGGYKANIMAEVVLGFTFQTKPIIMFMPYKDDYAVFIVAPRVGSNGGLEFEPVTIDDTHSFAVPAKPRYYDLKTQTIGYYYNGKIIPVDELEEEWNTKHQEFLKRDNRKEGKAIEESTEKEPFAIYTTTKNKEESYALMDTLHDDGFVYDIGYARIRDATARIIELGKLNVEVRVIKQLKERPRGADMYLIWRKDDLFAGVGEAMREKLTTKKSYDTIYDDKRLWRHFHDKKTNERVGFYTIEIEPTEKISFDVRGFKIDEVLGGTERDIEKLGWKGIKANIGKYFEPHTEYVFKFLERDYNEMKEHRGEIKKEESTKAPKTRKRTIIDTMKFMEAKLGCDLSLETLVSNLKYGVETTGKGDIDRAIYELKRDGILFVPREGVIRRTDCEEKGIPKELEPLAEEARKYESAEEFVENFRKSLDTIRPIKRKLQGEIDNILRPYAVTGNEVALSMRGAIQIGGHYVLPEKTPKNIIAKVKKIEALIGKTVAAIYSKEFWGVAQEQKREAAKDNHAKEKRRQRLKAKAKDKRELLKEELKEVEVMTPELSEALQKKYDMGGCDIRDVWNEEHKTLEITEVGEEEETMVLYHATIEKNLPKIKKEGLVTAEGVLYSAKWYMLTDSLEGATLYATGESPIIIQYEISVDDAKKILWLPGEHSDYYGMQYALRKTLPSEYIVKTHKVEEEMKKPEEEQKGEHCMLFNITKGFLDDEIGGLCGLPRKEGFEYYEVFARSLPKRKQNYDDIRKEAGRRLIEEFNESKDVVSDLLAERREKPKEETEKASQERSLERLKLKEVGVQIDDPPIFVTVGKTPTVVGTYNNLKLNFALGEIAQEDVPRFDTIRIGDRVWHVKKSVALSTLKGKQKTKGKREGKQMRMYEEWGGLSKFEKKEDEEVQEEVQEATPEENIQDTILNAIKHLERDYGVDVPVDKLIKYVADKTGEDKLYIKKTIGGMYGDDVLDAPEGLGTAVRRVM